MLKEHKRVVILDLHTLYFEGVRRQVAQEKKVGKKTRRIK